MALVRTLLLYRLVSDAAVSDSEDCAERNNLQKGKAGANFPLFFCFWVVGLSTINDIRKFKPG